MTDYDKNGYNKYSGLYKSRYFAKKACNDYQKAVKICGGYKVMSYDDYQIWKNQK